MKLKSSFSNRISNAGISNAQSASRADLSVIVVLLILLLVCKTIQAYNFKLSVNIFIVVCKDVYFHSQLKPKC